MQKFIATCTLTHDSEVRYSQDGKAVARFRIAIRKRFFKEGEKNADFFDCVAFGKTAEVFDKCKVAKGTKILIDAEVQNNDYEKQDGTKVYGTQILVNSFEFLESKGAQTKDEPKPSPNDFLQIPDEVDEFCPF